MFTIVRFRPQPQADSRPRPLLMPAVAAPATTAALLGKPLALTTTLTPLAAPAPAAAAPSTKRWGALHGLAPKSCARDVSIISSYQPS